MVYGRTEVANAWCRGPETVASVWGRHRYSAAARLPVEAAVGSLLCSGAAQALPAPHRWALGKPSFLISARVDNVLFDCDLFNILPDSRKDLR